jgi:hypothetical protein
MIAELEKFCEPGLQLQIATFSLGFRYPLLGRPTRALTLTVY